LGLDVGEVRIGVAVSDETGLIAQGLITVQRTHWEKDLQAVLDVIEEYGVNKIVVGNPINMNGTAGAQTEKVRDFIGRLSTVTPVEIALWDERLSSFSAERVLIEGGMRRAKRKHVIDKLAAVIILQNYLDHQNASHARLEDPVIGEDG
jgi:putative Holliday junction resolvase